MSTTDTYETPASPDPREEPEWLSATSQPTETDDEETDEREETGEAVDEMGAEPAESALTAESDYSPAFDEFTQNENTSSPAEAEPPASDDAPETESEGGVARPENLGGRDIGAGGRPLVAAEAQEEFLNRWTQIQVSFLEDPPAAVESAEALIQEISAAIRTSLEERGSELAAEGREASDTEQLRLALRQYRAFIGVVLPK